ncbi:MAG: ribosomal protein S18-alanine N-acetyltransferase [Thermodesulfovibrionales bacterium]
MRQILIRDMLPQDIGSVIQIERMSFSTPWSETSFFTEIYKPYSIARVALLDDTVVGYICIEHIMEEAHILNLAVHPDYRRMGIATTLIRNIIDELKARSCRYIYLEVRDSNYIAKRLYGGLGFKVEGIRKGYYTSPKEDAVVMMLEV